ncbi:MAG: serine--tRNA ligase, partial [Planctomycetes bacterium]|nr:serine--tRNA ligase [Planctomycetota bacterium]
MLDIKAIREDPERFRAAAIKKHFPDRAAAVDRLLALDQEARGLIPDLDRMRAEQKAASKELGKLSAAQREVHLEGQKKARAELQALEERERQLRSAIEEQLLLVPNVPDDDVPEGKDDQFNVQLRTWGELPAPDRVIRPHFELGEQRGWVDFQRAAQIAGSRNYFLLGDAALLQDAVLRFAIDRMIAKGFVFVDPPLLVKDPAMVGTAFFPGGEEQTYRCERDGLNLIGTAEVPVTSIHSGEMLEEAELPKRYVGRSACFRREAGTYGKDTKGLYRVHQFHKV